jgi:hypothetical protein
MDLASLTFKAASSLAALSLAAFAVGCGDSGTGPVGGGSASECPGNLAPALNSEFCANDAIEPDCTLVPPAAKHQVCGVALLDPPGELTRSDNVKENSGSGAPDVGCFAEGGYPAAPGASEMVSVGGFARIFSAGCDSHDLKITFYKVQPDGQLGEVVGTAVETPETCIGAAGTEVDNDVEDCDGRHECAYLYANVPTETELAIRTENPEGGQFWAPLVQYNIYISNSEVVDGVWDHDVRALAAGDYSVIPQAAIGGPVTPGNGVVAGEVHDCGDVRLSNAVADVGSSRKTLSYFSSNEDSPLPDIAAKGTSVLGLYAAFDLEEGPATVAAGGMLNGEFVSLGQHRVWVYPNTVTSVTFKGMRPYQLP